MGGCGGGGGGVAGFHGGWERMAYGHMRLPHPLVRAIYHESYMDLIHGGSFPYLLIPNS